MSEKLSVDLDEIDNMIKDIEPKTKIINTGFDTFVDSWNREVPYHTKMLNCLNRYKQIMEVLSDIDFDLACIEDVTHGCINDSICQIRLKLQEVIRKVGDKA